MSIDIQPCLSGNTLLLRPLRQDDYQALFRAASDPLIWEQHPDPLRYRPERFQLYFQSAMDSRGALAVIHQASNEIIGSSRYYQWDAAARSIFIGFTFVSRPYWGGDINREMKKLMLDHAFTFAEQVWFHVGRENRRSRKAMEKIGGVYSHEARVAVNGVEQDYVFYRMTRSDMGRLA